MEVRAICCSAVLSDRMYVRSLVVTFLNAITRRLTKQLGEEESNLGLQSEGNSPPWWGWQSSRSEAAGHDVSVVKKGRDEGW